MQLIKKDRKFYKLKNNNIEITSIEETDIFAILDFSDFKHYNFVLNVLPDNLEDFIEEKVYEDLVLDENINYTIYYDFIEINNGFYFFIFCLDHSLVEKKHGYLKEVLFLKGLYNRADFFKTSKKDEVLISLINTNEDNILIASIDNKVIYQKIINSTSILEKKIKKEIKNYKKFDYSSINEEDKININLENEEEKDSIQKEIIDFIVEYKKSIDFLYNFLNKNLDIKKYKVINYNSHFDEFSNYLFKEISSKIEVEETKLDDLFFFNKLKNKEIKIKDYNFFEKPQPIYKNIYFNILVGIILITIINIFSVFLNLGYIHENEKLIEKEKKIMTSKAKELKTKQRETGIKEKALEDINNKIFKLNKEIKISKNFIDSINLLNKNKKEYMNKLELINKFMEKYNIAISRIEIDKNNLMMTIISKKKDLVNITNFMEDLNKIGYEKIQTERILLKENKNNNFYETNLEFTL